MTVLRKALIVIGAVLVCLACVVFARAVELSPYVFQYLTLAGIGLLLIGNARPQ